MMAIGSYLALIIFVMGAMSSDFLTDEERNQFYQSILESHNYYRRLHNSDQLQLDQTLCDTLKRHTDLLEANIESEIPSIYGVNDLTLEFVDPPILLGNGITYMWYSQGLGYDFFTEPESPSKEIDKFTQMLWNDSKFIGVGTLIKGNKITIIVAYSPKGNVRGKYVTNVYHPLPTI